jgi:hypothetical protein
MGMAFLNTAMAFASFTSMGVVWLGAHTGGDLTVYLVFSGVGVAVVALCAVFCRLARQARPAVAADAVAAPAQEVASRA